MVVQFFRKLTGLFPPSSLHLSLLLWRDCAFRFLAALGASLAQERAFNDGSAFWALVLLFYYHE